MRPYQVRLPGGLQPGGKTLASGSGDGTVRLWDTAPPAVRYLARREAEALRPEADQLVARLFREKKAADAAVAVLRADESLSEPLRQAAFRAPLRRQAPRRETPWRVPEGPAEVGGWREMTT